MGRLKDLVILSIFQLFVCNLNAEEQIGSGNCPLNMDSTKGELSNTNEKIEKSLDEQTVEILEQIKQTDIKTNLGVYENFIENTVDKKLLSLQAKTTSATIEAVHLVSLIIGEKFSKIEKSVEQVNERLTKIEEALGSSSKERSLLAEQSDKIGEALALLQNVPTEMEAIKKSGESLQETMDYLSSKISNEMEPNLVVGIMELNKKVDQIEENSNSRDAAFNASLCSDTPGFLKKIEKLLPGILPDCNLSSQLNLTTVRTGKYYASASAMSWYDAKKYCEKYGMQLITINSNEEARAVQEASKNKKTIHWTSATDIGRKPGQFYWADGQKTEEWMWNDDEPNDHGPGKESCALLRLDNTLGDLPCSRTFPLICELHPLCKT